MTASSFQRLASLGPLWNPATLNTQSQKTDKAFPGPIRTRIPVFTADPDLRKDSQLLLEANALIVPTPQAAQTSATLIEGKQLYAHEVDNAKQLEREFEPILSGDSNLKDTKKRGEAVNVQDTIEIGLPITTRNYITLAGAEQKEETVKTSQCTAASTTIHTSRDTWQEPAPSWNPQEQTSPRAALCELSQLGNKSAMAAVPASVCARLPREKHGGDFGARLYKASRKEQLVAQLTLEQELAEAENILANCTFSPCINRSKVQPRYLDATMAICRNRSLLAPCEPELTSAQTACTFQPKINVRRASHTSRLCLATCAPASEAVSKAKAKAKAKGKVELSSKPAGKAPETAGTKSGPQKVQMLGRFLARQTAFEDRKLEHKCQLREREQESELRQPQVNRTSNKLAASMVSFEERNARLLSRREHFAQLPSRDEEACTFTPRVFCGLDSFKAGQHKDLSRAGVVEKNLRVAALTRELKARQIAACPFKPQTNSVVNVKSKLGLQDHLATYIQRTRLAEESKQRMRKRLLETRESILLQQCTDRPAISARPCYPPSVNVPPPPLLSYAAAATKARLFKAAQTSQEQTHKSRRAASIASMSLSKEAGLS